MEQSDNMGIKDFLDFLDECAKKDKYAWDAFVCKYSNLIYSYVIRTFRRYNYISRNEEVEDISHKVFLALLDKDCQRLKNFRGQNERSFIAYLREICFHIVIDFLREQKNFVRLEEIQNRISDHNQYDARDKKDLREIILKLRDDLPDRHQYLFKLIYEEEFELPEIAEIMNLNLNAAHQLKFRMIRNMIKIAKEKDLYNQLKIWAQPALA